MLESIEQRAEKLRVAVAEAVRKGDDATIARYISAHRLSRRTFEKEVIGRVLREGVSESIFDVASSWEKIQNNAQEKQRQRQNKGENMKKTENGVPDRRGAEERVAQSVGLPHAADVAVSSSSRWTDAQKPTAVSRLQYQRPDDVRVASGSPELPYDPSVGKIHTDPMEVSYAKRANVPQSPLTAKLRKNGDLPVPYSSRWMFGGQPRYGSERLRERELQRLMRRPFSSVDFHHSFQVDEGLPFARSLEGPQLAHAYRYDNSGYLPELYRSTSALGAPIGGRGGAVSQPFPSGHGVYEYLPPLTSAWGQGIPFENRVQQAAVPENSAIEAEVVSPSASNSESTIDFPFHLGVRDDERLRRPPAVVHFAPVPERDLRATSERHEQPVKLEERSLSENLMSQVMHDDSETDEHITRRLEGLFGKEAGYFEEDE